MPCEFACLIHSMVIDDFWMEMASQCLSPSCHLLYLSQLNTRIRIASCRDQIERIVAVITTKRL
jgi:hypothetical protein